MLAKLEAVIKRRKGVKFATDMSDGKNRNKTLVYGEDIPSANLFCKVSPK